MSNPNPHTKWFHWPTCRTIRAVPAEWLGDSPAEPVAALHFSDTLADSSAILIDFPTPLFESLPVLAEKETLAAKELLK